MAGKKSRLRLIRPDWPAPPGVTAVSTTRQGGFSSGSYGSLNLGDHVQDNPEQVEQNRNRLILAAGLPRPPHWLTQVHGAEVADLAIAAPAVQADGAISFEAGQVCAVLTADCLPVLMCSDDGNSVAAIHAGWRGLAAGVIDRAAQVFEEHGVGAGRLMAWLGPAISAAAYEVGMEVRDQFLAVDQAFSSAFTDNGQGGWQLDLYNIARQQLVKSGIARVFGGGYCTFNDCEDGEPTFFSHRRVADHEGVCGRQATLIWRG